jgi:hypothetical protein
MGEGSYTHREWEREREKVLTHQENHLTSHSSPVDLVEKDWKLALYNSHNTVEDGSKSPCHGGRGRIQDER